VFGDTHDRHRLTAAEMKDLQSGVRHNFLRSFIYSYLHVHVLFIYFLIVLINTLDLLFGVDRTQGKADGIL
jgi:ABC-type long-subunit fatty acid transport system fused permease/ATPase subunit